MRKILIACMVLFMAATVGQAEMWDVLVDGSVWSHNVGEPHHNGYGNMTAVQHATFNEYEIEYVGECPEGSHYAGKTWLGVVALRSRYQRVFAVDDPEAPVPVDPDQIKLRALFEALSKDAALSKATKDAATAASATIKTNTTITVISR